MGIDHEFIFGSFFGDALVVLGHPLGIVVLAAGDDSAYVAGFDGINSFGNHVGIGGVHAAFVIGDGAGGFVVHDEAEAFGLCVFGEGVDVVVGIWTREIEDIFFPIAEPIFPALVPSFDEDAIEAMLGRKIDVAFHVRGVGAVFSASEGPIGLTHMHFPPHAYKFLAFNPAGIFDFGGFIEVQNQFGSEDLFGFVGDDECAPRSGKRAL